MKKKIDVFEHMGEILNGVKNGVLITGNADAKDVCQAMQNKFEELNK